MNVIDLHGASAPVARTIVRRTLKDAQQKADQYDELLIITGRGLHSVENEAVLRPTIMAMFAPDGEFHSVQCKGNAGSVVIPNSSLRNLSLS